MKTEIEWDQHILKITMTIKEEFPELSERIVEMPFKMSEKVNEETIISDLEDYYNSLKEILSDYSMTHKPLKAERKADFPLDYPPSEDIYNKGVKVGAVNPEDLNENKSPNEKRGVANEKDFNDDKSGDDLDVLGSELDDQQESVGSEDEENNYYSLGGDKHDD